MTHTTAKLLLERYFLCETTPEEEAQLRAYFRAGDIHPDLAAYPPMFAYWDASGSITAPAGQRPAAQRRLPGRWLAAAAAAAALVFGLSTWFNYQPELTGGFPVAAAQPIDWSKYEVTDPEEAYRILRGALKTASTELNRAPRLTLEEIGEVRKLMK